MAVTKWFEKEWLRWILAGAGGVAITVVGYSYKLGSEVGSHITADKSKWEGNDAEHAEMKALASKTTDKLDGIATDVAVIKGEVNTLLRLQEKAASASAYAKYYASQVQPIPAPQTKGQ